MALGIANIPSMGGMRATFTSYELFPTLGIRDSPSKPFIACAIFVDTSLITDHALYDSCCQNQEILAVLFPIHFLPEKLPDTFST